MLKLPDCSGDKVSIRDLRKVYDEININVRGLGALGVKAEQYGSLLIPIIMSKLPLELRVQVDRKTASELWEINGILEIIRKELEAREISESVRNDELRRPNETWKQNRQQNHNFSAASLFVKDGKHERKIKCVYCGQNLYSASCQRVKDNEEKKSILRDQKRCCLCLQTGHRVHEKEDNGSYYLPHHGVFKFERGTTKLQVALFMDRHRPIWIVHLLTNV